MINIQNCTFRLIKTLGGDYLFDGIYDAKKVPAESNPILYSHENVLQLKGFLVPNKGTVTKSRYKSAKGFLNRIQNSIN
jgi:hypothetical protein